MAIFYRLCIWYIWEPIKTVSLPDAFVLEQKKYVTEIHETSSAWLSLKVKENCLLIWNSFNQFVCMLFDRLAYKYFEQTLILVHSAVHKLLLSGYGHINTWSEWNPTQDSDTAQYIKSDDWTYLDFPCPNKIVWKQYISGIWKIFRWTFWRM